MTTVGVIGGGQLAWMMAKEAPTIGVKLMVQTPDEHDSAVSLADKIIPAPVTSLSGTKELAQYCDVITFENEFVDLEGLQKLADEGVCFRPSLQSLAPLLDKYDQRTFLADLGLPVPKFKALKGAGDCQEFGFPVVLKARRHGYDGQGTIVVRNNTELNSALAQLHHTDVLIEEFIPFERELAVIAARSVTGEIVIYPVVETYQKNQICHWVIAPTKLSLSQQKTVENIAQTLLRALDYVGVMGIELFLTKEGNILVNETAPRTHNSGHYTLDGCITSQFALQLQAVTGKPFTKLNLLGRGALMVNLLGHNNPDTDYELKLNQLSKIPHSFIHWYNKKGTRLGRKLGHITIILHSENIEDEAKDIIKQIEAIWN
ncbi:MAG: 5-(carboxyamino)imidazole ribonucleotide synthase [Cyanobacterium sp. T60_A2020_053]|nr:5-(carboxyamino)imidazole ribonucleotide synthase [Cyanobacterium sp. T60_A2020_053]